MGFENSEKSRFILLDLLEFVVEDFALFRG